jgi:hypothetical protein
LNSIRIVCLLVYLVSVGYILHDVLPEKQKSLRVTGYTVYSKTSYTVTSFIIRFYSAIPENVSVACVGETAAVVKRAYGCSPSGTTVAQNGQHARAARDAGTLKLQVNHGLTTAIGLDRGRATLVARLQKLSFSRQWEAQLPFPPKPLTHMNIFMRSVAPVGKQPKSDVAANCCCLLLFQFH